MPSPFPSALPARLSPRGLQSRVTSHRVKPSLISPAHRQPQLCFGRQGEATTYSSHHPPHRVVGMALLSHGQGSSRDRTCRFERARVYNHPFSWRLSWLAALPGRTGWGAAANTHPHRCLSMLGWGFWGSLHPLVSPRVKLGLTPHKGLGAMPNGGDQVGQVGIVSHYLETVISVWGPCAFSRPSLVKMPTSTMMATTPHMM